MHIAETMFFCVALLSAPMALLFTAEIFASLVPRRGVSFSTDAPAFTVIVPAHDEAAVIAATLASIALQLRTTDRLLVVADNCSDDTADIAARAGATVSRRDDPARRGKGYALAHGVAVAAHWDTPVTIVVDADCWVGHGALEILARTAASTGRPVQGRYLLTAPPGAGRATRFRAFAIRVKNYARLLGGARLGVPCLLTGSGMAFPTAALARVELESGEIVEDLLLGLDLAIAGLPPRFCSDALITSPLPIDRVAAEGQRSRWERGYLSVTARTVPHLLRAGLRSGRMDVILLAIDLAIPPLSLLVAWLAVATAVGGGWAALGGGAAPLLAAGGQAVLVGAAVLATSARYGRGLLSPLDMLLLPLSAGRKLGFYLRLVRRPPSGWIRTARDAGGEGMP